MSICPSQQLKPNTDVSDFNVTVCEPSTKGILKQKVRAKTKDKPAAAHTNMKRKLRNQITARYKTRTGTEY